MNKIVFQFSTSVFLLIAMVGVVQAAELRFQCTDAEGPFSISIDTASKSVTFGDVNYHGQAVIKGTSISMIFDDGYRAQLNTRSGVLTDPEGGGSCKRSN